MKLELKNFEDVYAVAPLQSHLLSGEGAVLQPGPQCVLMTCKLLGKLDLSLFERAWQRALSRHTILRTSFVWKRIASPLQVVHKDVRFSLAFRDWRGLPSDQVKRNRELLLEEELQRGIDPARPPLMRVALCRLGDDAYLLAGAFHSLILDGRSLYLLLQEVLADYQGACNGTPTATGSAHQYWNYIDWLGSREETNAAESFWTNALNRLQSPTCLPTELVAIDPSIPEKKRAEKHLELSSELTESLIDVSVSRGIKPSTLIHGAWALLLSRYTGEESVVFGTAVSGRPKDLEAGEVILGPFEKVLPVCVRVPRSMPISSWLEALEQQLADLSRYEFSFAFTSRESGDASQNPALFETVVMMDPTSPELLKASGIDAGEINVVGPERAPLTLKALLGPKMKLSVDYDASRFDALRVKRILRHLRVLLEGIASLSDRDLQTLQLITSDELQLLALWNHTETDYRRAGETIHGLLERQAEITPERIAAVCEDEQISYSEMNRRANRLARYLEQSGIGLEDRVGIYIERSMEMLVGILAVLKAGAAYVPIDPGHPEQRQQFMLENAGVTILLIRDRKIGAAQLTNVRLLYLEDVAQEIAAASPENVRSDAIGENLAYVIYTSGSTGRPKGVLIPHKGVVRLVRETNYADLTADDVVLQFAPLSFDASTFEIWGALLNGARLVVTPSHSSALTNIGDIIQRHSVTTAWMTAALFDQMIDQHAGALSCVRQLLAGGDVLSITYVRRYFEENPDAVLINGYGPTENTTFTCTFTMRSARFIESSVPIGRPIANTTAYIADESLSLLPPAIAGELLTGGTGLARGYLNDPVLTAEKFIPDAFGTGFGGRLYRTGDLTRFLPDGNIEFLGRKDLQVKIRGFRIEPQEIEEALRSEPEIKQAVVLAKEVNGDKRLVAYVVTKGNSSVAAQDLKRSLREKLPDFMVPGLWVMMKELPITPNGKIDRRALPPPGSIGVEERELRWPRDSVELHLTHLWEEMLGTQPVGLDDSFFDLGGHSLLAARLMVRISKEFGQKLPLASLLEAPSVEAMARLIRQKDKLTPRSSLVRIRPGGHGQPFFCVHPAGGSVLCYAALAQRLDDGQPFYGLQAKGLDDLEPAHSNIEEMAAHYIAALRDVQPEGPYLLGGWSMGGVVAFEMARNLEASGQGVALLVLLDSRNPHVDQTLHKAGELSRLEAFVRHLGIRLDHSAAARARLLELKPEARLSLILDHAKKVGAVPRDLAPDGLRRRFDLFNSNVQALRSYVPKARQGRIVLLKASEAKHNSTWDETLGWAGLAAGGVEVHEVPGDHFSMMRPPHVEHLADQFAACIRGTWAARSAPVDAQRLKLSPSASRKSATGAEAGR